MFYPVCFWMKHGFRELVTANKIRLRAPHNNLADLENVLG